MSYQKGNPWMICESCNEQVRLNELKKGVSKNQRNKTTCPLCHDLKDLSMKPQMSSKKDSRIYKLF